MPDNHPRHKRPPAFFPSGLGLGVDTDNRVVFIDFFGGVDEKGQLAEVLGSYAIPFNRAKMLAEQLQEAIKNGSTD